MNDTVCKFTGPKTLLYALLILTKFIALATLMDKLHVWIQHVFGGDTFVVLWQQVVVGCCKVHIHTVGKPCQYIQSVFTPLWYMELQDGFDWIPLDDFALVRAIHCTRTMPCSFGTTTATNCSRTVQVKRRQGGKKSRMAGEAGRQVWEC